MTPRTRASITSLFVIGLLLMQSAWLLAVAPFGGVDEFDHAFRASAAAHGEWFTDHGPAEHGRGLLVTVNDGVAEAARAQCEALEYTGRDNCRPVTDLGDGQVLIASAAAIYQPTYYASVGWVTWFLDGSTALYAMRVVSMLLCLALFALTIWVITGWARSPWPVLAAAGVLTPTMVYSNILVAPNGLEIMLALALWACLIGTCRTDDRRHQRGLLLTAIPLAVVLAWVRPLSAVWLLLILIVWAVLLGRRRAVAMVRAHTRLFGAGTLFIGVSSVTSVLWVLGHPSMNDGGPLPEPVADRWGETFHQVPLWFLQVISAVPYRGNVASIDVYAAGLVEFTLLLLPLLLSSPWRTRVAAITTAVGALVVGLLYTYSRLPTAGPLWQGRYAWCLALGVVLLAGIALEDRPREAIAVVGLVLGAPALAVAQLRALSFVLDFEHRALPKGESDTWVTAPTAVVLSIAAVGLLVWGLAARRLLAAHAPVGTA